MSIAFAAASLVERVGWLLVHSVWQFALIAIALAVVLRIMRHASAGARYAAALTAWSLMLAAPVSTWLLLPAPDAGAQFAPVADASATLPQPAPTPALPLESAAVDALAASPVEPPLAPAPPTTAVPVASVNPSSAWTDTLAAAIAPWLTTLVAVWCVGVCVFGAWSAAGWVGVRRLLQRDVVSVPDEMTTLLVSVLKRVGLNHRVRLLQSPHVAVPLVVGWLRPVILLPVCVVTGFPPAQLEAVLAHELAHIRRHDYLINLLQLLSETVFFYHPALWWVSGVVRHEREHCCDELAAQALGNRAEYGRALVALEELRGTTPSLALGAKGGSLLERIRRLAQREQSPQWSAEGIIELALMVAVVLAAAAWTAVDAGGQADDESVANVQSESDSNREPGTFSFGGRVEVLAIGTHDQEPQQWWNAEGKVLESVPFEWSSDSKLTVTPKFGYRRIVFRVHDLPEDAHVNWKTAGSRLSMGGRVTLSDGTSPRDVFTRYFSVDQSGETCDLRVGVAAGPWKSVVSMTGAGAKTVNGVNLLLSSPIETESETSVVITHNVRDRDYRVVAIDTEGQVHDQVGYGGYSSNGVVQATARFPNLRRKEIDRFEFQLREYEWIAIDDLPLEAAKLAAASQSTADAVVAQSSPIGAMSEVSVADQVAKYAFEAEIPADHQLWITLNEVPQRRGYAQANVRLRKKEPGRQRMELEFAYSGLGKDTAENPLLSTINEISYGWSAPGCDKYAGTSIFGVPLFNLPTADKKIVLVDPNSEMAQAERGTRLLLIIPKDANPQTRSEVEAIQPRGEIVAFLEKIEPPPRPRTWDLQRWWRAQQESIGSSYIRYRRFRQGAGALQALAPEAVAKLLTPGGQLLTADQALAAASELLVNPESKLFGPENGTFTFRSVGNKSLETSERDGAPGDARYCDGELDIHWDAANRQAKLHLSGQSQYGRTTLHDFSVFKRLASLRDLSISNPTEANIARVESQVQGRLNQLMVESTGFAYSWQVTGTDGVVEQSTFQFEPQVHSGGIRLPRLKMEFHYRSGVLEHADIVLIEEARLNEGFAASDFALPLPAGTFIFDYRGGQDEPAGHKVREAVNDAAAYIRRIAPLKSAATDVADPPAFSGDPDTATTVTPNAADALRYQYTFSDPQRLPSLPDRVTSLQLHGPLFADADLAHLAAFTKLKHLGLTDTKVEGAGLQHVAGLSELTSLNFEGGSVSDEWLEQLPDLPKLRRLTVRGRGITDAGVLLLKRYPSLEDLYIYDAPVGDAGIAVLDFLPHLKRLALKHTQVSDTGLEHLMQVPELEYFSLGTPNVTGPGLAHLATMQKLTDLQFVGPGATDRWMRAVEPLRSVQWLELHSTSVTSDGIAAISGWTKLVEVYLNSNPLSDDAVEHLKDLRALSTVELLDTQVTAAGGQRLRELLPSADVRVDADDQQAAATGAAEATAPETEQQAAEAKPDDRVRITVIQAKHVLLLDGKQIVTWQEIDEKIAALPDPSRAYPQLYVTTGAMNAGLEDAAQQEAYELHKKYKLSGHSVGSLLPRTDVRYDQIQTPADLIPNPALRLEGTVVDAKGQPVAGAEVVLVTPVPPWVPYRDYDIAIVEGRIRNPVDEVLTTTDDAGRFVIHVAQDTPFSVLALHPEVGIALVDGEQLRKEPKATLLKWGGIVAEFSQEPEEQSATLYTQLEATPTRPRISIGQYWEDLKRPEKPLVFGFTRVPPIWQTSIMRSFPAEQGVTHSVHGASVSVLPGETRVIALGPVTEQLREFLKEIRER